MTRDVLLAPADNVRLVELCGPLDEHLHQIEARLGVEVRRRGNRFQIIGLNEAINRAGLILQLDCPDLAMGHHIHFVGTSVPEFRKIAATHVAAINAATANIPPDRMRMHLCWANYHGPHHHDIALSDIIDIILGGRPAAISYVAANPRHEHEFELFRDLKLPAGKILIPGVVDSTSNFIEHPRLVAQRIVNLAKLVGRENVIAGTDCGFGTFAGSETVDADIAWAKLSAMAEGARIASKELWA